MGNMRAAPILFALLPLCGARSGAAESDPAMPVEIPGYELRVLDARKPLLVKVGNASIEASLPVFIYYPKADRSNAVALLRRSRDSLRALSGKAEWTAADVDKVIADLDTAIAAMDTPVPKASKP
jgi:hypothetical protein